MSNNKLLKVPNKEAAAVALAVFDFDGVFTDNTVHVNQKGEEMVRCFRGDGLGLTRLKKTNVQVWVLSTEKNPVVKKRCQKLGLSYKVGLNDKAKALLWLCKNLKLDISNVIYVGNDINDIEAFKIAGIPIAVSDAYDEVKKYALYQTKRNGGFGAVREICDWIVACKNYQKKK